MPGVFFKSSTQGCFGQFIDRLALCFSLRAQLGQQFVSHVEVVLSRHTTSPSAYRTAVPYVCQSASSPIRKSEHTPLSTGNVAWVFPLGSITHFSRPSIRSEIE